MENLYDLIETDEEGFLDADYSEELVYSSSGELLEQVEKETVVNVQE